MRPSVVAYDHLTKSGPRTAKGGTDRHQESDRHGPQDPTDTENRSANQTAGNRRALPVDRVHGGEADAALRTGSGAGNPMAACEQQDRPICDAPAIPGGDPAQPDRRARTAERGRRSEAHTSELQPIMSISYAVFWL